MATNNNSTTFSKLFTTQKLSLFYWSGLSFLYLVLVLLIDENNSDKVILHCLKTFYKYLLIHCKRDRHYASYL